jgi:hypothetical protein
LLSPCGPSARALSTGTRIAACEHLFVTSQGSAYGRFQRALATGNLQVIEAAAAELPAVGLDDALAILVVLAQTGDPDLTGQRRAGSAGC